MQRMQSPSRFTSAGPLKNPDGFPPNVRAKFKISTVHSMQAPKRRHSVKENVLKVNHKVEGYHREHDLLLSENVPGMLGDLFIRSCP